MNKISTVLGIFYGHIHKMIKKAMSAIEGVIEDEIYVNADMKGRNR